MPRYRRYRRFGKRSGGVAKAAQRGLTQLVTFAIVLYAFDLLLGVIMPMVNESTFFGTTITFINAMIPVVAILGAYVIIKGVLKNAAS